MSQFFAIPQISYIHNNVNQVSSFVKIVDYLLLTSEADIVPLGSDVNTDAPSYILSIRTIHWPRVPTVQSKRSLSTGSNR